MSAQLINPGNTPTYFLAGKQWVKQAACHSALPRLSAWRGSSPKSQGWQGQRQDENQQMQQFLKSNKYTQIYCKGASRRSHQLLTLLEHVCVAGTSTSRSLSRALQYPSFQCCIMKSHEKHLVNIHPTPLPPPPPRQGESSNQGPKYISLIKFFIPIMDVSTVDILVPPQTTIPSSTNHCECLHTTSLVPRPFSGEEGGERAWYALPAHASIFP